MNAQARQLHEPFDVSASIWLKTLAKYRQPRFGRSVFELSLTAIPFAMLWAGAYVSMLYNFWFGYVLVLPAAAFLLRLFMIQHDCGHGSFVSGVLTAPSGSVRD